jgi:transposase
MLIYEQVKNAFFVARHFGISKKTFYKWRKRYINSAKELISLLDRSKKPKKPCLTKKEIVKIIKKLRKKTNFGPDRLRLFLLKDYNLDTSLNYILYP